MSEVFTPSIAGVPSRLERSRRAWLERLPWGELGALDLEPWARRAAARAFAEGALREHETARAFAALATALLEAQAPLDLVSRVTDFVADELLHTELHARLAEGLGGAEPLAFEARDTLVSERDPALRAVALALRVSVIGETFSQPVLAATLAASASPLVRAVLRRVVVDEGPHARVGALVLEALSPRLGEGALALLATHAHDELERHASYFTDHVDDEHALDPALARRLGFLPRADYLACARASLERHVLPALARLGLPLEPRQLGRLLASLPG